MDHRPFLLRFDCDLGALAGPPQRHHTFYISMQTP